MGLRCIPFKNHGPFYNPLGRYDANSSFYVGKRFISEYLFSKLIKCLRFAASTACLHDIGHICLIELMNFIDCVA